MGEAPRDATHATRTTAVQPPPGGAKAIFAPLASVSSTFFITTIETAGQLGIGLRTLYEKLKEYGLD